MTLTAVQLAAAVRNGEQTARSVTEQALRRIGQHDNDLHAFRLVRAEAALAEADAVDGRADLAQLPLAGVPVAIKDNIAVTGEWLGNGSAGTDRTARTADHPVVQRLRAAGAVVIGLTNVPELCVFASTDSPDGITRNPWNLTRTPGGSSGGSAAAVAAGLVPLAHANDGLGSIRIPAACAGLVGIKPGLGLVPAELGNGSWFAMAENGPLATTVADCALMLSVLADRPELAELTEPDGLRIGVSVRAPLVGLPVDRAVRGGRAAGRPGAGRAGPPGRFDRDSLPEPGRPGRDGPLVRRRRTGRATAGRPLEAAAPDGQPGPARPAGAGHRRTPTGRPNQATPGGRSLFHRPRRADHAHLGPHAARRGGLEPARLGRQRAVQRPLRAVRRTVEPGWLAGDGGAGRDALGRPSTVGATGRPARLGTVLLGLAAQLERLLPWPRTALATPTEAGSGDSDRGAADLCRVAARAGVEYLCGWSPLRCSATLSTCPIRQLPHRDRGY